MKQVELIDGRICRDHIHMYVAVPSEMSVSEIYVVSQRKEYTDAVWQTSEISDKVGRQAFLGTGYYVATVGNVNEETILKYIQEQEENDKLEDGRK